jgi:uncharacterized protein
MHYLKGALFESLIISEFYKHYYNHGKIPYIHFWRDHVGNEVDCILEEHQLLIPVEIKAATTISTSFFNGLSYWNNLAHANPANSFLIYGGNENQKRSLGTALSWNNASSIFNLIKKP